MSKPIRLGAEQPFSSSGCAHLLGEELDVEVGALEAEVLFSLLARDIGAAFYNQGLRRPCGDLRPHGRGR
ncbi:MAG: DUF2164 family protein [Alphaproteobacteria bacterium]|nr:DUF2164 family protein [Alphaproteobacteria bacterium]